MATAGGWCGCIAPIVSILAVSVVASGPALAQGCRAVPAASGPARTIVTCPGVTIEVEGAARFGLGNPGKDGTPQLLHLDGGAALIDVKPGAGRTFQIQTPHAIASVRGTQWVVDATPTMTAVFVARGKVGVMPREGGSEVALAPGDGVDVTAAGGSPSVVRWGERRVRATLARFGR